MPDAVNQTVELLLEAREGDPSAQSRLFVHLQQELKRIARMERYRWHGNETMNATAILHEAYIKLTDGSGISLKDRAHFLALAGKAMRQVLQDYARGQRARKRGGNVVKVSLDLASEDAMMQEDAEFLDITWALDRLEDVYPDLAAIVECRFFSGMTVEETADALGISRTTVNRRWSLAQSLLFSELKDRS